MGRTIPADPASFFRNLGQASTRSLVEAFVGGMIFNLGNLLLVAAISVAGMAVAFPLGAGLALVIGAVLNYVVLTGRQSVAPLWRNSPDLRCHRRQRNGLSGTSRRARRRRRKASF
jgi:hypothetical protein